MKKIITAFAVLTIAFVQQSFAQDSLKLNLLNSYYNLKDALVKSNPGAASAGAADFLKHFDLAGMAALKEEQRTALRKDAMAISESKDLKIQRKKFATLSAGMAELAKTVKLSPDPVYLQYCPMQDASWLSNTKSVKNPYYGSAMLTCGSVKATY